MAVTGWQSLDIGSPSLPGSSSFSNGVFTVTGSGSHIGSTSDQFQFDYQAVTGAASIVASLATPLLATDGTQPLLAQGGVMFRSSGSADASFVEVAYINGQGIQMLYRNGDGTAAAEISDVSFSGGTLYVRLDRTGSTFTGYYSTTGTTWTLIGSIFNPAIGSTAAVGLVANSHNNSKLVSIGFSNVSITEATTLPPPWHSGDIGSPTLAGSGSFNNGVYTITGSGSEIGGTSDQFQFDYQSVTGPASIVASFPTPLVATDGTQPSGAQGGVMFRGSVGANSPFVELVYSDGLGIQMLYRNGYGATTAQVGTTITYSGPLYVRLVRTGWTFTGYYSSNGTNWTLIGSIFNPAIGTTAVVGLVACSESNSELVNVIYNNVTITPIASLNGSTLDVNLSSAGPITVSTSGGNAIVTQGSTELIFADSSFNAILVTDTASGDAVNFFGTPIAPVTFANTSASTVTVTNGTLDLANNPTIAIGSLTIKSASVAMPTAIGTPDQLILQALTLTNGVLDLNDNVMFIQYTPGSDPISSIVAALRSGFNNGGWNGPGIVSSAISLTPNYSLGWADGADGVVAGLPSGQIEVKYTLLGDANLDGTVNGSDFSILAANFGKGVTNWDQGNFLFSSAVNGADFSALAANFGQGDSWPATSSTEATQLTSAPKANSSAGVTYAAAVFTSQPAVSTSTLPNDNKDAKFLQKR